eukprot:scaffold4214_cov102-Cylindrotheca_fusiformis.AAC.1
MARGVAQPSVAVKPIHNPYLKPGKHSKPQPDDSDSVSSRPAKKPCLKPPKFGSSPHPQLPSSSPRRWRRLIVLPSRLFDIPSGPIGKRLCATAAKELRGIRLRQWNAERFTVFFFLCMLQRSPASENQDGWKWSKKLISQRLAR